MKFRDYITESKYSPFMNYEDALKWSKNSSFKPQKFHQKFPFMYHGSPNPSIASKGFKALKQGKSKFINFTHYLNYAENWANGNPVYVCMFRTKKTAYHKDYFKFYDELSKTMENPSVVFDKYFKQDRQKTRDLTNKFVITLTDILLKKGYDSIYTGELGILDSKTVTIVSDAQYALKEKHNILADVYQKQ